jgi:hypothetical protein
MYAAASATFALKGDYANGFCLYSGLDNYNTLKIYVCSRLGSRCGE